MIQEIEYQSINWKVSERKMVVRYNFSDLPKESGIYLIAFVNNHDFVSLIPAYIGSSVNILSRIRSHHKINHILKDIPSGYEPFILYHLSEEILSLEKELISKCSPKFNVQNNGDYNELNCSHEDYNNFCLQLKKQMDGRQRTWLSNKLGINLWELTSKLRKKPNERNDYLTKDDIKRINEIFRSNLILNHTYKN